MRRRWQAARPWTKAIVVTVVALIVAGAATGTWLGTRTKDSAFTVFTRDVTAQAVDFDQTVSAAGTVAPSVVDNVSFAVGGTVAEVDVTAGQTVTAGQKLATLDVAAASATRLAAVATLAQDQARLATLDALSPRTTTVSDRIAAAQEQITTDTQQLSTATTQAADTTLVAPIAGQVTTVGLTVGESVAAGTAASTSTTGTSSGSSSSGSSSSSSSSSGSARSGTSTTSGRSSTGSGSSGGTVTTTASTTSGQFVIDGNGSQVADLSVSDAGVAKIAPGDQVTMTSTDVTGTLYGVVTSVGLVSTTTSGVASYPVVANLTGNTQTVAAGTSVTAAIIYQRRANVLEVPTLAVTTSGGVSTVDKVGSEGATTRTVVTLGQTSGSMTEITSGLATGDTVQITVKIPKRTTTSGTTRGLLGNTGTNRYRTGGTGSFGGGSFGGGTGTGTGQRAGG